jgi:hypothetical protein
MKEVIKKEILGHLTKTIEILREREVKDYEELKSLSNHAIEDVALHKDLDLISVTVLIYSIYKIIFCIKEENYKNLLTQLELAKRHLQQGNFRGYNKSLRKLFGIVKECNAQVKVHLQDVMQAARIRKGTSLLERGLSIGQAAGLMGLSNWDLQQYAAKTTSLGIHTERIPARTRMKKAFQIFRVQ